MTKKALEKECEQMGLSVDTWSPGDGYTRYRFFKKPGADYFASDGIYTALGLKEAQVFLTGYSRAYYK